jgi:molecular chaperone GrpE
MEKKPTPAPDVEAAPPSGTEGPSPEEQIKKLEEEKKALFDQFLRRQADFENFRKRTERERQEERQTAGAELVTALLPVLDAFERALAHPGADEEYRKGIELIYKQLSDALVREGLKPVAALGQTFDPFLHHAVERVETTDHNDQEVLAELQRGYTFRERLLRPALVRVAVAPAAPGAGAAQPGEEED